MTLTVRERPLARKDWREKTPAEVSCGRCDVDEAGPGSEVVSVPGLGLIVACASCLREMAEEETPPEDD